MSTQTRLEILLVEDNLVESELLRAELSDAAKTQIEIAHTPRLGQACDWLRRQDYDAVLLDLGLPDSVGWPTFLTLKTALRNLPPNRRQPAVVVFTGRDDEEMAIRAMHEGAEDYIVKGGCEGPTLLRALRLAVHRHRGRKRLDPSPPLAQSLLVEDTKHLLPRQNTHDTSGRDVAEFDTQVIDTEVSASNFSDVGRQVAGNVLLEAGHSLGHFLISRQIGQGGMSVVYAVHNRLAHRSAALKILRSEFQDQPVTVARFLREVRANARIVHPNVVRLFDAGRIAGISYIEMELVRGQNAQQLLEVCREGVAPQRAAQICADACRGLVTAHAAGILHRDIKPSNLLLQQDGRTKLADFGLATFCNTEEMSDSGLTGSGHIIGTLHYLSPEQGRGETVDVRSDVYSVGATFYSLLTGQPPYAGSGVQVIIQHDSAPVPDPRRIRPVLPQMCSEIITRAMAKNPADRFQTAQDLLVEFEQLSERDFTG